jgi:hypothetical protein
MHGRKFFDQTIAVKAAPPRPDGIAMVRARIADMRPAAVDSDGDAYSPGAFNGVEANSDVVWGAWGHASYSGTLPVGRGAVVETSDQYAEFVGALDVSTPRGCDYLAALKTLGSRQQWSYGYRVLASHPEVIGGQRVRVLDRVLVEEVSMVLSGAGVDTMTLAVDGRDTVTDDAMREYLRYVWSNVERLGAR